MPRPQVTITMPVYNGMPLIKASIASLINQTFTDWVCIIVDDGSTDGTSEYLDSLSDPRFIIHHQPNRGRSAARQKALDMSGGEYLAMLDAGDLYHPDKLARQVEALERNRQAVLVSSMMCSFGTRTDSLYVRGGGQTEAVRFDGVNPPCFAASLLRTSRAKEYSFNRRLQLGEDVDFLEKYLEGAEYLVLDDVLYYYSEFDSVTEAKIRSSYRGFVCKYFRERRFARSFEYALKYLYSVLVFPLMSIDAILSRRGIPADDVQAADFRTHCLPLIKSSLE